MMGAPGAKTCAAKRQSKLRIASTALACTALTLPFGAVPGFGGAAQIIDPSRNVPQGSPVSQSQPQSTEQTNGGAEDDADNRNLLSTPVERTEVRDAERSASEARQQLAPTPSRIPQKSEPSEFERFVEETLGRRLPRFGDALLVPGAPDFALPSTAAIPPDYILNVGDTVSIGLTGSVEGTVQREIDNDGQIFLPRVGAVRLAGIQYRDLKQTISRAIGLQYRGFDVSASVTKLRGIRVYVTGFANSPGEYTVNSLSTLVNAVLAAGGPNSGGSFRSMQLLRNGQVVSSFDLYDLLRRGDRSGDAVLQNEDVLYIPPVGVQVAVAGSVNDEAIYELKPGETMQDAFALAGGLNALADPTRAVIYRSATMETNGPIEVQQAEFAATPLLRGDIVQAISTGSLVRPTYRQPLLVRIEGEVERPGVYHVPPNSDLGSVLALAGGTTPRAYAFGTRVERVSVRRQQRESYQDAIRQLEISLASAPITSDGIGDQARDAAAQAGARELLDRLRQAEPDGRVVVDIAPAAASLPASILLENNDRIVIPARASVVGVYGAVYRPASFLIDEQQQRPILIRDYVKRAGGTLRAADRRDIFVVRANGAVLSRRDGAMNSPALPGDVIFVPVRTSQSGFLAKLRDITSVVFQLGLGAAAFAAVVD